MKIRMGFEKKIKKSSKFQEIPKKFNQIEKIELKFQKKLP